MSHYSLEEIMSEYEFPDDTVKTPQTHDSPCVDCQQEVAIKTDESLDQCGGQDDTDLEDWFRALTKAKPE